jgi:hypothetical protein
MSDKYFIILYMAINIFLNITVTSVLLSNKYSVISIVIILIIAGIVK